MIDRRLAFIGLPVVALAAYFGTRFFMPVEIEFTRAAPAAPENVEMRSAVSTAYLDLPVDLSGVGRRTQAALEHRLATPAEQASALSESCARRPAAPECVLVPIGQNGPIAIETQGSTIKVKVPVRIDPTAGAAPPQSPRAGQNAAQGERDQADRAPLDAVLAFHFTARPSASGGFELIRRDDVQPEGLPASVSTGQLRMLRQVEARLRPVALSAHDELRQIFNALPVSTAVQAAWTALSQPIELGAGAGIWLRPVPELVGAGQIVTSGKRTAFRIPIYARLSIDEGGRGTPPSKRPVINGQILTQSGASIRIATALPLDQIQTIAKTTLVGAGPHAMRPDRFGPPVKIEVHRVRTYPSVHQLGFELDLSASRYEGQNFRGKAYFVARPELDAATRVVTLADVALTPIPTRETGASKVPANAPRLASEPLSTSLAKAVRLDVAREVGEAVPRYRGLLHQRIGDKLVMSAQIEQAVPVGVETARSGLWLLLDLNGTLTMTYDGPAERLGVEQPTPSVAVQPSVSRLTSSANNAAAAVVSGAAVTAAAAAQTRIAPAATSLAQPTAASAGSVVTLAKPPVEPTSAETEPAKAKPTQVKTKVLSSKPRRSPPASKVATKPNWVPFAQ